MARLYKEFYPAAIVKIKQVFYAGLSEKERRHFLGQEYLTLGVGSQRYISRIFGCSRDTISKGFHEVNAASFSPDYSTQRAAGAGRKKKKKN